MVFAIREYLTPDGRSPFREWLQTLDVPVRARVQARVVRFEMGNLGITKSSTALSGKRALRSAQATASTLARMDGRLSCSCLAATRRLSRGTFVARGSFGQTT